MNIFQRSNPICLVKCLTLHGFRADVIEAQLAHNEPDTVRLAYNRAEYMEERRQLTQKWANYLDELRATKR